MARPSSGTRLAAHPDGDDAICSETGDRLIAFVQVDCGSTNHEDAGDFSTDYDKGESGAMGVA